MADSRYDSRRNNLAKICGISVVLGIFIGNSLYYHSRLSLYFIIVASFHLNEFLSISKYSSPSVNDDSFLIWNNKGSKEYWMVQLLTILEFMYSPMKLSNKLAMVVSFVGAIVSVLGIILRLLSIRTLGSSFTHYINRSNTNRPLMITGIFAYVRHPSYLGFYIYVIGIELYLKNGLCLILVIVVMTKFFRDRIRFEEYYLVKAYGQSYKDYQQQVKTYIPFV